MAIIYLNINNKIDQTAMNQSKIPKKVFQKH